MGGGFSKKKTKQSAEAASAALSGPEAAGPDSAAARRASDEPTGRNSGDPGGSGDRRETLRAKSIKIARSIKLIKTPPPPIERGDNAAEFDCVRGLLGDILARLGDGVVESEYADVAALSALHPLVHSGTLQGWAALWFQPPLDAPRANLLKLVHGAIDRLLLDAVRAVETALEQELSGEGGGEDGWDEDAGVSGSAEGAKEALLAALGLPLPPPSRAALHVGVTLLQHAFDASQGAVAPAAGAGAGTGAGAGAGASLCANESLERLLALFGRFLTAELGAAARRALQRWWAIEDSLWGDDGAAGGGDDDDNDDDDGDGGEGGDGGGGAGLLTAWRLHEHQAALGPAGKAVFLFLLASSNTELLQRRKEGAQPQHQQPHQQQRRRRRRQGGGSGCGLQEHPVKYVTVVVGRPRAFAESLEPLAAAADPADRCVPILQPYFKSAHGGKAVGGWPVEAGEGQGPRKEFFALAGLQVCLCLPSSALLC